MKIKSSTGVVLSSKVIGEADIITSIYTDNLGKHNFVFKGLKKSKKRSKTAAEPGTILKFYYYYKENKNSYIINDFQINKNIDKIRNDLSKILNLHFMLETILRTVGENDKQPFLFKLISAAINQIDNCSHPLHLSLFFLIHLIRFHGIFPEITICSQCKAEITNLFLIDSKIKILCQSCAYHNDKHPVFLSKSSHNYLKMALTNKFKDINQTILIETDCQQLLFQLCLCMEAYFNTNIKSKQLLFQILY